MDLLRNERSPYIKIGIVKNERTSKERIFEHQTGNPRKIHLERELETPFVSNIETIIHHLYNQKRVAAEWFMLTPQEMDEVYTHATAVSQRFQDRLNEFEQVQLAKDIVSTGEAADDQRLDVDNGILLSPTYDALFDRHLITFDQRGRIQLSDQIEPEAYQKIGVDGRERLKKTPDGMKAYLEQHQRVFEGFEGHG